MRLVDLVVARADRLRDGRCAIHNYWRPPGPTRSTLRGTTQQREATTIHDTGDGNKSIAAFVGYNLKMTGKSPASRKVIVANPFT